MDREEENKERSENFQPTIPLAREETVSDQSADNNPLEEERWFFKGISGKEAERTILEPENKEGSFLIRESRSNKGCYALLVKHWDPKLDVRVIHYKIFSSPSGYYINPRIKFISLQELVKYYHADADGLCQRLASPSLKKTQNISETDGFEIPRKFITLGSKLEVGHLAEGKMKSNNTFIRVSVKVQNVELTPDDSFLREVSIRKALQHVCLVQLLGVMTRSQPMLIITEFMSQGNLKSYLRSDLGRQLELVLLIDFAIQVVDGMIYLEENCYVHRDLRSANILLSDTLECKIGDFSLTRKLKDHRYILLKGEKVAVKWTAPEVFKEESHTTKSDVWSFGIFLMELVTFGQTPYPGLTFAQTLDFLENGLRMQRPVRCTEELFCVMSMCWEENPWSRPSFKQLRDLLENL
ncbi:tyrosine-protein kinase HCK-like isoform X1 [Carcharodon carcharias]|uniref:tyrosine-protein kinase HCK-like isoform X1 n=1 Tax=Carcharodon carcharias TaxID=13397 RepID=UPI001B7E2B8D|nr:tyrosine-protein kinase HCK-like isoform X1 [Carcharodon carcharias]XP_041060925.1 tyrosine-protein kinase HCK-like isoform X1 [Carcharodon carcharias]XP_041060926.1 tyrosine-protein kinase HCK-like isoform X1 [Carcharodon carcharias]XP_041060927.1 tyrosine-protein kinase HCK-like isoform X1 [Carcharodon carcharias]XP_041060928.1 tyrosine-protein kinase HCK-like isoform X1 [Carcharodon carcharias]XP_041060929.1 tyrosine-protein kinase HCK-like isoform X1 [Carcharodon carcharias]XP_04106093